LPEVAGDAAISVDPYDVPAMSRGLRALEQDEALRLDLEARGRIQAANFSVEAYRTRLTDLYAKVGA
jgi:glycosyltransferase involved in cell wall biosynthesis